jgi:hypothetical protein
MVVIETPDGTQSRYHLAPSRDGWRLVHRYASYDLLTMIQSGWSILVVEGEADRSRLEQFFRRLQPDGATAEPAWQSV